MSSLRIASLVAVCLVTACTTPPPFYASGGKTASNPKAASVLMGESVSAMLAKRFEKSSPPPKAIKAVMPEGSPETANHGGMGVVLFEVSVNKEGKVKDVKVLESPNQYLSADVIKAFSQWEFTPLLVDGQPKEFDFKLRLPFNLRRGA